VEAEVDILAEQFAGLTTEQILDELQDIAPTPTPPSTPEEPRYVCNDPSHQHLPLSTASTNDNPPARTYRDQETQTPLLFTLEAPIRPHRTDGFALYPINSHLFRPRHRPSTEEVATFRRSETIPPASFLNTNIYLYGKNQQVLGTTAVKSTLIYFDRNHGYPYEIHIRSRLDKKDHVILDPDGNLLQG
jgi:hypothetical protein